MRTKKSWIGLCFLGVTLAAAQAQTFTVLVNFNGTNGATPWYGSLVQGLDSNLYGTTSESGGGLEEASCIANESNPNLQGTVFVMTLQGQLGTLLAFDGTDGAYPCGGLTLATDGTLYGSTTSGGTYNGGTIFQITTDGAVQTLDSLLALDTGAPYAAPVEAFDGMYYGTVEGNFYPGWIFQMTPAGTLTTLYTFNLSGSDGSGPYAPLVQRNDGLLYGVTYRGGSDYGEIFSISLDGAFSIVHSFSEPAGPIGGLVQVGDALFGTTSQGGTNKQGMIFRFTDEFYPVHNFAGADGANPYGTLIQGSDGNLYGTTVQGGAYGRGTIFKLNPSGVLTVLHSFNDNDGAYPYAGVTQGVDGNFYGTTSAGGQNLFGTIYRLSTGLAPFVKTVPWFGKAGSTITIVGSDLSGVTGVTFNGLPAPFSVLSATAILATVPAGAENGTVQVATLTGTLSSNVPFQVLP